MKIAIDTSALLYGTGVSVYTRDLIKALLEIDQQNDYLLFGGSLRRGRELKNLLGQFQGKCQTKVFPIAPTLADFLWNRLHTLPIERLIGKVDVLHSSDWTQPPSKAFKVTTVHDLAPLRFPRLTHPRIVSAHKARLTWVKKEVDRVIVPSLATQEDLIDFGIKEEKIRVIPEAASIITKKAGMEEIRQVKKKYNIDGDYLVTVGVGQRKNTTRLIEAFEKAAAGQDLKLVLIGRSVEKFKDLRNIRFTGRVTDEEFRSLVTGATLMVYPSLYEGFGLPILEAFNAGVPVVTSNTSGMPEVAGDAAILVDPYEIESISEGIKTGLRRRKSLIDKATARASRFSWKKAAEMTLTVYLESRR